MRDEWQAHWLFWLWRKNGDVSGSLDNFEIVKRRKSSGSYWISFNRLTLNVLPIFTPLS